MDSVQGQCLMGWLVVIISHSSLLGLYGNEVQRCPIILAQLRDETADYIPNMSLHRMHWTVY